MAAALLARADKALCRFGSEGGNRGRRGAWASAERHVKLKVLFHGGGLDRHVLAHLSQSFSSYL